MSRRDDRPDTSNDAINDPDVLWAVIEGLLARLAAIPGGAVGGSDPVVLVANGDPAYHRHPRCPLLVEFEERPSETGRPSPTVRRLPVSAAGRAGLAACRACRTHRPVPPLGPGGGGAGE